jgi:hypothetical protein
VLFSDVPRWNQPAIAIADRRTKHSFRLKNTLGVMPQRAVAKIAERFLSGI